MGRHGGWSRSPAKVEAARRNLELANSTKRFRKLYAALAPALLTLPPPPQPMPRFRMEPPEEDEETGGDSSYPGVSG